MDRPHQVTRALAGLLSAAELDRAMSLFANECCFVTPDATAVRGRSGIRAILAQLIAGHAQLRVTPQSMQMTGRMALCRERWTFTYTLKGTGLFSQDSDSTILLRHTEHVWRLSTVAPWHSISVDRPAASLG